MLKTSMVRAFQQGISVRQNGVQNELQRPPKRGVGSSNLPGITKNKPLTIKYSSRGLFLWLVGVVFFFSTICYLSKSYDKCCITRPHYLYGS